MVLLEEEAKKNGLTFNPEYLEMRDREERKVRIVEPDDEAQETTTKSRFRESSGRTKGPKVGKYKEEIKEEGPD